MKTNFYNLFRNLLILAISILLVPQTGKAQCGAVANYKPTASATTVCTGSTVVVFATGLPVSKWIYRDNNTGSWQVYNSASDNASFFMSTGTTSTLRTFKAIITTSSCANDTTLGVDVTVIPYAYGNDLSVKLSASVYDVCSGSTITLRMMNQSIQQSQWLYRDNGGNWNVYTNTTSQTVSFSLPSTSSTLNRDFRVVMQDATNCKMDSSDLIGIKVNPSIAGNNVNIKPTITQQSICGGSSVSMQVEWPLEIGNWIYKDANDSIWRSFSSGSSSISHSNTLVTATTQRAYKVILKNPEFCTADTSDASYVMINASLRRNLPDVLPKITGSKVNVCAGSSQSFQLQGYNSTQWYYRDSVNGNWNSFGSGSSASVSSNSNLIKDINREVRVVINNSSVSCSYDTSGSVFYTIKANIKGITTTSMPFTTLQEVCSGAQIQVFLNNGLNINNWLYRNNNTGSWINGGSGTTYYDYNTNVSVNTLRSYKAVVSNTALCRIDTTPEVQVNIKMPVAGGKVNITPTINQPAYCVGATVGGYIDLSANYAVSKWIFKDNNATTWTEVPFQNSSSFNDSYTSNLTTTTIRYYKALVKNLETFRIDTSNEMMVTINPLSRGNIAVNPTSSQSFICNQNSYPLTVVLPADYTVNYWIGRELPTMGWNTFGSGSTTTSDYVSSVNPSKTYRVILFNSGLCKYDTSNALIANINQRIGRNNNAIVPTVDKSTVCSGTSFQVKTSSASGLSISKWMYRDNGGDWKNISSSSTTYNESASNTRVIAITQREYKVVINDNNNCTVDTTASVMVTISPLENGLISGITPVTTNTVNCAGNTITIYLNNYSGTVQKWVYRENGGNWTEFNGSSASTYLYEYNTYVKTPTNREYRAFLVRTGTCIIDTTQLVALQIKPYTYGNAASVQPSASTVNVCSGSTYSVSLVNYNGTVHKWIYRNGTSGDWLELANSTSNSSLSQSNINVISNTIKSYRSILLTSGCSYDTTASVNVQVNARSYGYANSVALTSSSGLYCSGSTISANISSSLPSGSSVRKWMYMDNMNGNWLDIPSSTSTSISHTNSFVATTTTRSYRTIIGNTNTCSYDSSGIYSVTINPSTIGVVSINPTSNVSNVCNANTTPYLTLGSYSGTILKWLMNTDNKGWTDFGYTTNYNGVYDYNVNVPVSVNRSYRAVITNPVTCSIDSTSAVSVTISPNAIGNMNSIIPQSPRAVSCYTKPINVTVSGLPSGYSVTKWIYSNNNGEWNDFISSTGSSSLTDNNTYVSVPTSRSYRAIISNTSICRTDSTGTFTVLINSRSGNIGSRAVKPTANNLSICAGSSVNVSVITGNGNEVYRWTYSDSGTNGPWYNMYNAYNSSSFNHGATQVTTITDRLYRAIITDTSTCDFDSSQAVMVNIKPKVNGTDTSLKISSLDTICTGTSITLSITPGSGNSTVKWLYNENFGAWKTFTGNTAYNSLTDYNTLYPPGTTKGYTAIVLKGVTCSNDTLKNVKNVYIKNKTYGNGLTNVSISSTDTICAGNSVSLNTSGTVERWLYSEGNATNWQVIPSSASTSYTHTSTGVTKSTWRYYRAIINTGACNADSSKIDSVYLRVYQGGMIAITPTTTNTIVCSGNSLNVSISVSNATIIRWMSRDNGGSWVTFYTGSASSVSDNNTYLSTVTLREYRVLLLKNCSYDTTNTLTVTITPKTNGTDITKVPTATSTTVCAGNAVQNIQVSAGSGNTILKWLYRDNAGKWNVLVDGNSNNISDYNTYIGATVTRDYVAVINNNTTCKYDTTAKLTVTINPVVLGNNNSRFPTVPASSCMGSSYNVSMNVSSDTSIIRFFYNTNGGNWIDRGYITPTTSFSFSEFASTSSSTYTRGYRTVLYKASTCKIDTSAPAYVSISQRSYGNENGVTPTGSSNVCAGASFNVSVSPGSGNSIQYWLYSDNDGSWNIIYSALTSISQTLAVQNQTIRKYRAMILKGSSCTIDTSAAFAVTINPIINGSDTLARTTVSGSKGICTGSSISLNASNLSGATISTWLYRDGYSGKWNNMYLNSTSITDYSTNTSTPIDRQYALLVYKSATCRTDTTTKNDTAFISNRVYGYDSTFIITTPNASVCTGTQIPLTGTGIGSNSIQQWLYSDNGGSSWYNLLYASSTTLTDYNTTVSSVTNRKYRLVVRKNSVCRIDSGAIKDVTINPRTNGNDLTIVPVAANAAVCSGNIVSISMVPGSGNTIQKWMVSNNGVVWSDFAITSSTSVNDYATTTSVTINRQYKAIISKGSGCSVDTSASVTVSINPIGYGNQNTVAPVANASSVCSGTAVSLSISGFSGSSVLKWLYRDLVTDGWSVINNGSVTITDFNTTTSLLIARQYRALVVNASGCSFDTTGITTVTINPIANGVIGTAVQSSQSTVCTGNPINVFINTPSGYTINHWLYRNSGGDWTNLNAGTSASINDYNTVITSNTSREYRVVLNNATGCSIDSSGIASVNINLITQGSNLAIVPVTNTQTICSGTTAIVSVSGFSGTVVQWMYRDSSVFGWNTISSTGFTLYHTSTNVSYTRVREYRALLYNANNCSYDTSGAVQLTINPQLQGNANSVLPTSAKSAYCSGATITANATGFINGGVVTGWLYKDGNGPWIPIASSGNSTINHNNTAVTALVNRQYRALVFTGCSTDSTASLNVTIDVYPVKPIVQRTGTTDTLNCSQTAATYQWKLNGANITGATSKMFIAQQNGTYTVTIGNVSDCKTESDGFVFVKSGINEEWLKHEISLYPNPTLNGLVSIEVGSLLAEQLEIQVVDMVGRSVLNGVSAAANNKFVLDLTEQKAGVYFVTIKLEGYSVTKKVVYQN